MIRFSLFAAALFVCALSGGDVALAQDEEDVRPRAYVGRYIQLDPIMVPFQTVRGLRYEVITVRLVIGANSTARSACFVAPKVHEMVMFFLWDRGMTAQDFSADKRPAIAAEILDFIRGETDERYYNAVELVGGYEEIDEDSQSLSNLCK